MSPLHRGGMNSSQQRQQLMRYTADTLDALLLRCFCPTYGELTPLFEQKHCICACVAVQVCAAACGQLIFTQFAHTNFLYALTNRFNLINLSRHCNQNSLLFFTLKRWPNYNSRIKSNHEIISRIQFIKQYINCQYHLPTRFSPFFVFFYSQLQFFLSINFCETRDET